MFAAGVFLLLGVACSTSSTAPDTAGAPPAGVCRDSECPAGEECDGSGCVPVRPTLYPHIQLASALFRPYIDETEIDWRADHFDLLLGHAAVPADRLRAGNPNVRLFEYTEFRYHLYPQETENWAALNGVSAEDFFLHYREDVNVPGYGSTVLVPGFPPGVVPGWNPGRGPDDPPASASERAQSRIFGIPETGHEPWHLADITDPGYRRFHIERMDLLLDGSLYGAANVTGPVDGVMVDHAVYYPMFNEGLLDKTDEFYGVPLDDSHPYALGFLSYYADLREGLEERIPGPIDIMPNLGHIGVLGLDMPLVRGTLNAVDWVWGEVWIMYRGNSGPTSGSARAVTYEQDYPMAVTEVVRQSRAGRRCVLGARDLSPAPTGSDRGKLYTLALYYLLHNPNTFYSYESYNSHLYTAHLSQWQWNPAVGYDIGRPAAVPGAYVDFDGNAATTEHFELATGADPFNSSLTFHVLARNFTKGMVVVKMLPIGSVVDDRSLTTHSLDNPYRVLRADGTPGTEIVTEISIRNNEGFILVLP